MITGPSETEVIHVFEGVMGKKKRLFHVKELIYFKRQAGTGKALLTDGTTWLIDKTTNEMENELDANLFFKINRNIILSFNIIDSYKTENKKGEVVIKEGFPFDGD